MKIFLGTSEIAGMMTFLSKAFRELGHEVTTCVDNDKEGFYDSRYDILLNKPLFRRLSDSRIVRAVQVRANAFREHLTRRSVFRANRDAHDLYLFMWNGLLPSSVNDYAYLKSKGKKIVSLFLGSDVRHVCAFVQEYGLDVSTWEQWFHSTRLNDQLFRLRKAELYSDAIFSVKDQDGLAVRPYYKLYIPFDASALRFSFPGREIPKLVHIPSRSGIKGSPFIMQALDELKAEGLKFDFEFITGVPNNVVLDKLQDADVLVDEIFLHGPGTLSLEGMASGCAVATKTLAGEVYDTVICGIDITNVKDKLRKLISDLQYRRQLANEGRGLIEAINNPAKIARDIIEKAFDKQAFRKFDYYPEFFANHYTLPVGERVTEQNRLLTEMVIERFGLAHSLNVGRMKQFNLIPSA